MIVNRAAGTARNEALVRDLRDTFGDVGVPVSITEAAGHEIAAVARRAIGEGCEIIVAAGGDGTVSAAASALVDTSAALGVLPLGTLNHFAKDLGIPMDVSAAARAIATGRVVTLDVGEVNGYSFINNSSVGLYPRLVWERSLEQRRGRHKWHAFAVAVFRIWRRYRRVAVTVGHDGGRRTVHTPFVFVGNNEYLLEGAQIGGRQRLDEGVLHVCMAPGLQRLDVIRVLFAALAGKLQGLDRFESLRTPDFSIAAQRRRLGVSLDGELMVLHTPLRYRIRPRALRVLVPAEGAAP